MSVAIPPHFTPFYPILPLFMGDIGWDNGWYLLHHWLAFAPALVGICPSIGFKYAKVDQKPTHTGANANQHWSKL